MAEFGTTAHRLTAATESLDPPLAALDLPAMTRNAHDLVRRAGGVPIRVASKSVRCRAVLERVLAMDGFAGVMAYSLAEAIWLSRGGVSDILVGYPTALRGSLVELASDAGLVGAITVMIDDVAQLEFIAATIAGAKARAGAALPPIRICLDIDASLRVGKAHLGVRRSPIRTPDQAAALARDAVRLGFVVVGVMFYEAQIAGLPDSSPAVRVVKRRSAQELAIRRSAVVAAVRATGIELEFVNSGGTGSLEISAEDPAVTEVTAGSGLYASTLFDGYDAFNPDPAMFFALPVVRRPTRDIATLFGGGYIASGPTKKSRQPLPVEDGFALLGTEGAGEVQTPLRGPSAELLRVGDRVWLRHAKAGELLERFDRVHLVQGSSVVQTVPSYRGEGQNFG
ncbi:amino acid deaminase/aldolase [Jatrophihabitans telluris]|uniref:Amino acid deaminase/aldolase n=1 Tax=Jatrophihabitans telluris TaxID=2038343 RepID=A0ABY4QZQ3_9ACTN|nr:amino acid deaminase/aldolase [Jatrophihabitans telluris]UQX89141.1 amino acid deaminase/aldolase [Jatrophihabitans telluris]